MIKTKNINVKHKQKPKQKHNKYQKSASVIRLKKLLILFATKCVKYI